MWGDPRTPLPDPLSAHLGVGRLRPKVRCVWRGGGVIWVWKRSSNPPRKPFSRSPSLSMATPLTSDGSVAVSSCSICRTEM